MPTWLLISIAVVAGALGNVFMKIATQKLPPITFTVDSIMGLISSPYVILAVIMMAGTFPVYNLVLQRMSLHVAFPLMTSLMFILATVISFFFLKESLTVVNALGILVVVAGLFLVAR